MMKWQQVNLYYYWTAKKRKRKRMANFIFPFNQYLTGTIFFSGYHHHLQRIYFFSFSFSFITDLFFVNIFLFHALRILPWRMHSNKTNDDDDDYTTERLTTNNVETRIEYKSKSSSYQQQQQQRRQNKTENIPERERECFKFPKKRNIKKCFDHGFFFFSQQQ